MKRAGALLALLMSGCIFDLRPNDAELRTGMTQEEMDAAPGHHQTKAALIYEVRQGRMLDRRLEEGRSGCSAVSWREKPPLCLKCQEEVEVYSIRQDIDDQPYREDETAYYCRKESVYYYHYVGGKKKLDVWLGPYELKRKRVKPEE